MLNRLKRIFNRGIEEREISYKTAKQMMKKAEDTILLDVRSKQEYSEGNLPGSINVSLYDLQKNAQNIFTNKSQNIICYCSSGNRSKQAQKLLENMGYNSVYNLKGGLDAIDN